MDLLYKSTRDEAVLVSASQAILKGLSEEGGLFVPSSIPKLSCSLKELSGMSYQETAYEVMKQYLTDFTKEELQECIKGAYGQGFDSDEITPLVRADKAYFLELFHGKTIAFKDMALSILPYLLKVSARKNKVNNEIVILTATSGDTGKAALSGFGGVAGTKIIVFYPKDGVSKIQELQMVTQQEDNTHVIGVRGNFDDCQSGVKQIFGDRELKAAMDRAGYQFSSANSINIGRLVPQVVYYVYAYARLLGDGVLKPGEPLNVTVPTGNFGNILAAYYAKEMGVPLGRLICASNENKVLFDFFEAGVYDRNREFILTSSPSMDILISSNLERLIYHIAGNDAKATNRFMKALSEEGAYRITEEMREGLFSFTGGYAKEEETFQTIKRIYDREGYLIDTHTAVAAAVYDRYREQTKDQAKALIISTASPYKFAKSVLSALDPSYQDGEEFDLVEKMQELSRVPVPEAVKEIKEAKIIHRRVCQVAEMEAEVKTFLGL